MIQPGPDDHKIFIIHNDHPNGDAQTPVKCASCDDMHYTAQANLDKALSMGLTPTCVICALVMLAAGGEDMVLGGFINEGRVNPVPTKRK